MSLPTQTMTLEPLPLFRMPQQSVALDVLKEPPMPGFWPGWQFSPSCALPRAQPSPTQPGCAQKLRGHRLPSRGHWETLPAGLLPPLCPYQAFIPFIQAFPAPPEHTASLHRSLSWLCIEGNYSQADIQILNQYIDIQTIFKY